MNDAHRTTHGSAARRDGKVTIAFGVLDTFDNVIDIEVDVTAYAVELARDILTAYSTPGLGRIDQVEDDEPAHIPLGWVKVVEAPRAENQRPTS